jgi:hypothetical protein
LGKYHEIALSVFRFLERNGLLRLNTDRSNEQKAKGSRATDHEEHLIGDEIVQGKSRELETTSENRTETLLVSTTRNGEQDLKDEKVETETKEVDASPKSRKEPSQHVYTEEITKELALSNLELLQLEFRGICM